MACVWGGNLLTCLAIVIYEPFVFWGVPLLFLLSLRDFRFWKSVAVWFPALAVFLVCCKYSGGEETCRMICQSVSGFLEDPGIISFLRKSPDDAVRFHLATNFGFYHHVPTALVSLVSLLSLIYYFVNGFYVFSNNEETKLNRQYLLLTISFVLICQIPMFTVLSIDYSRTCIVSAISSLMFFFSLKQDEMERIFHPRVRMMACKVISSVDVHVCPTPFKIIFLLMFIGVTTCTLTNEGCFGTSELGEIGRVLLRMIR